MNILFLDEFSDERSWLECSNPIPRNRSSTNDGFTQCNQSPSCLYYWFRNLHQCESSFRIFRILRPIHRRLHRLWNIVFTSKRRIFELKSQSVHLGRFMLCRIRLFVCFIRRWLYVSACSIWWFPWISSCVDWSRSFSTDDCGAECLDCFELFSLLVLSNMFTTRCSFEMFIIFTFVNSWFY